MNWKKLFGSEATKETGDDYTIENVMEYLRQEGFRPIIDEDESCVIRFKYQHETFIIVVVDNFYRISSLWEFKSEEHNVDALYAASMKTMNEYRYIRITYVGDVLEFAIDQSIASLTQFKEVFNISMALVYECERMHQQEYRTLADIHEEDDARRDHIYQPEFRWLPDVVFKAVTDGQLAPEALTDEDWIRTKIQKGVSSEAATKEWESFKINRVDNYGEYKLIVYQFPEPKVVPEAKYGAVLLNTTTRDIDYYTLEKTFNDKWVYGSMSAERHSNYGEVDTDDLEKFIEWIFTRDKQLVSGVDYTKEGRNEVN